MSSLQFEVDSIAALPKLARQLLASIKERVVLFKGDLGAGKTSIIKALCDELGVEDEVNSPTFSIVNEYLGAKGEQIFHFDWYRLEDESEAWDIGWEDYLERGDYLFIEWPEKIRNLLPHQYALIEIEISSPERRSICLSHYHE